MISELEFCFDDEEIPASVLIDNWFQPLLDMIQGGRSKNKQLDVKIQKMIEWRNDKKFHYEKVSTKANLADLFTKALDKPTFNLFINQLMTDI